MKRLLKRSLMILLAASLILSAMVISVSASPPGQANRMKVQVQEEEEWGVWFLPPGLVGKGIPPGLAKKGYDLPPGLMGRENLPPGIQMRFRHTHGQVPDDYEAKVTSIEIVGPRIVPIPDEGVYSVTYHARVLDQYRQWMDEEDVTWTPTGNLKDVSFTGTNSLVLKMTVGDEAVPNTIKLTAVSESDSKVTGSVNVQLVREAAGYVYSENTLREALADTQISVIHLMRDIVLEERVLIERDVIIEGHGHKLEADDISNDEWLIRIIEDSKVTLRNTWLDGNNETGLDGLVRINEGSELTARNNHLTGADLGFGIWVDKDDYDEDDLEALAKDFIDNNVFESGMVKVEIYDGSEVLYP